MANSDHVFEVQDGEGCGRCPFEMINTCAILGVVIEPKAKFESRHPDCPLPVMVMAEPKEVSHDG